MIYAQGAPPCMAALGAALHQQSREEACTLYVGNLLWTLAKASVKDLRVEPLSELMDEHKDTRSGEEILRDLMDKL